MSVSRPAAVLAIAVAALASVTLNQFGSDTVWPFVLNLYAARDRDRRLTPGEMAEVMAMLESFLVRRMFNDVPTNQLNRLFLRLWAQLAEEQNVVDATRAVLSEPSRRWPADDEFAAALACSVA